MFAIDFWIWILAPALNRTPLGFSKSDWPSWPYKSREPIMNAINKNLIEVRETADLVRAAQAGNRDAFGELFERFQPTVLAIAMRRLRDHADAQELCQDVFVQAMLKIEQLRTPEAFIGWLRQITVRMAINRAVRRAPAISVEPEMLEATVTGSESCLLYTSPSPRDATLSRMPSSA